MIRALVALAWFATAICGVKGAPRPPEKAGVAVVPDAGTGELFPPNAPGQPPASDSLEANEPDPFAGFLDGGKR